MGKSIFLIVVALLLQHSLRSQSAAPLWPCETTDDSEGFFDFVCVGSDEPNAALYASFNALAQLEQATIGNASPVFGTTTQSTVPTYLTSFHFVADGKNPVVEQSRNRLELLLALSHLEFTKQYSTHDQFKSVSVPIAFMIESINLDQGFGPRIGL